MADEIDINQAATEPKSATADGVTVTQHSLDQLIKAKKYLDSQTAASKTHNGLRFAKLIPPGTIQD